MTTCSCCKNKQPLQIFMMILAAIQIVLGALIALMPFVIAPVCPAMPNGHYMSCHYSGILLTVMGVIFLLLGLVPFLKIKPIFSLISSAATVILAALSYMIPHKILKVPFGHTHDGKTKFFGLCGKADMPCIHSFEIIGYLLLVLGIVAVVYFLVRLLGKEEKNG